MVATTSSTTQTEWTESESMMGWIFLRCCYICVFLPIVLQLLLQGLHPLLELNLAPFILDPIKLYLISYQFIINLTKMVGAWIVEHNMHNISPSSSMQLGLQEHMSSG